MPLTVQPTHYQYKAKLVLLGSWKKRDACSWLGLEFPISNIFLPFLIIIMILTRTNVHGSRTQPISVEPISITSLLFRPVDINHDNRDCIIWCQTWDGIESPCVVKKVKKTNRVSKVVKVASLSCKQSYVFTAMIILYILVCM